MSGDVVGLILLIILKNSTSIINNVYRNVELTFLGGIHPNVCKYHIKKLGAGWGMTDNYLWQENDDSITVKINLSLDVPSKDIRGGIYRNRLDFNTVDGKKLISGETIRPINVEGSFWNLVKCDFYKELIITIKKEDRYIDLWNGVIKGDRILHTKYDDKCINMKDPIQFKRQPDSVIWESGSYFNYSELFDFISKWDMLDEYGLPSCNIKLFFLSESYGARILFGGDLIPSDVDEWLDLRILEKDEKYKVLVIRGPRVDLINGVYGINLSMFVQQAENQIVRKLQIDLNKRFPNSTLVDSKDDPPFDYELMDPFKNIDLSDKSLQKYFERELGYQEDWTSEKRDEHTRQLIDTIDKLADRSYKPGYEFDKLSTLYSGMKNTLGLSDSDMTNLFNDAIRRIEDRKLELSNTMHIPSITDSIKIDFDNLGGDQTVFNRAMDLNNSSILSDRYHSLPVKCQEMIRERWERNALKLDKLVDELLNCEESLIPTICDNYKDLLLSEDYPTIFRSKITTSPPKDEFEKTRYLHLQNFVLSLYKDLEVYMMQNEMDQLTKINEICEIAKTNIYAIDDFMYDNKSKYDMDFVCYLKFAIHMESKNLENEGLNPDLEPSVWLMILKLIYKGISFLIRDDISEHTEIISIIVERSIPMVRKYMTEYYVACMARSDWKAFKDTVDTIANGISKMTREEIFGDSPDLKEWIPEAVLQLQKDVEELIPDWVIDGMLSPSDIAFMETNNNRKIPICRLRFGKKEDKLWPKLDKITSKTKVSKHE